MLPDQTESAPMPSSPMPPATRPGAPAPDTGTSPVTAATAPRLTRTTGRLASALVISLLAGLVLQVWTMWYLGRLGPEALYIRSIFTPVGFIVLAVAEGLVITAQVVAGTAAREGRRAGALWSAPTFLAVGAALLMTLAVGFAAASGPLLSALAVPAAQRHTVTAFVTTVCLASALALVPGVVGAVVRGVGRTWTAAALGGCYTVLAMAAMPVMHRLTGTDAQSVPLGELVAAVVTGAAALAILPRTGIELPRPRLDRQALQLVLVIALPIAATFLSLSLVTFGYLRVLRNAGSAEVTGFSLGQMATQFFLVPAQAIGSAAAIAANLHAHPDRTVPGRAGLAALLRLILPAYLVTSAVIFLARHPIAALFAAAPRINRSMVDYLSWSGPALVLFGGTFAMLTFLEQTGRAREAFVLNIAYFAVLLIVAFLLPQPVHCVTLARLLAIGNLVGFWTLLGSAGWLLRRRAQA